MKDVKVNAVNAQLSNSDLCLKRVCSDQFDTIGTSSTMSTGLRSLELWAAEMFEASKKEAIIGPRTKVVESPNTLLPKHRIETY